MVSMDHYAKIMAEAAKRNYKVLVAGDRNQLTAVEHGGGFAFLADELGCVQLPDPVRFVAPWEQDASMRLRLGDTSVLTEYAGQGRVHGAPPDQAKEAARQAYVAEYLAGRDPLLMVESNELAAELNQMIRSDLQHLGYASTGGPEVTLMEGTKAGIGDPLVLRKNYHKADSGEPGRGLANGDTLEITAIADGVVTVRRLIDSDRETGERRYTPEFAYPYASRSQLAHVVTAHRAQGRTVTVGMALFTGGEEHEWAYPALTRGWESNHAFVFTSSARLADPSPGTRVAPELSRWARIQRERDALDALADPDAEAAGVALEEALGVLSDVLERPGRELSASQWKAHSEASADHLGKAHVRWQSLTADLARTRYEAELRACLPEDLRGVELTGTATWLWRTLRDAEAAGLNSRELLQDAIEARSLGDARDVVAVVDDRIRRRTGGLVPLVPRRWAEQVPPVAEAVIHDYLTRLAESMDARTERLAAFITANPPAWAVQAIGPVPEDPVARLQWQARVAPVAAYRELFGWDNPSDPIGPEPANAPEQRAAWHGAFAALGPVNGPDLRSEPDGRLWLMMGTYGNATAWAPRYTGRELRFVRVTARDMGLRAVRHAAEAQAAQQRGDLEAAERHAAREARAREVETRARDREASLAASVDAYHEWERVTEHERHLAVAARAELVRRHPEQQIPPLRSDELAPPDEAERAELLWPRIDRQGNVEPEPEGGDGERGRGDERRDGDRGRAQGGDRGQDRAQRQERVRGQDQGQERERERVRVRADGTPDWVRQVQRQTVQVQEKVAERTAERVPNEDPDYEDVGSAWPGLAEAERDAIFQPAKPQIEPAPQVAEKVAQRERGYANADPEAEG
jgi:hypothetical protein